MLKITTDAKINGLQIESFEYIPTHGFPLIKAKVGLLADGQLCASGEIFSWGEETEKLFKELLISMEKDCAKTYFGKTDYENPSEYDVASDKKRLTLPEERFHDEWEIEQF